MHYNWKYIIYLFVVFVLCLGAFSLDLTIANPLLLSMYLPLSAAALAGKNETMPVVFAAIISGLILLGLHFSGPLDKFDITIRIFTLITIWVGTIMSVSKKIAERDLKELNDILELKVLARTAASEAKSQRLEQQIQILKGISQETTQHSFDRLNSVIENLKQLAAMDDEELEIIVDEDLNGVV